MASYPSRMLVEIKITTILLTSPNVVVIYGTVTVIYEALSVPGILFTYSFGHSALTWRLSTTEALYLPEHENTP